MKRTAHTIANSFDTTLDCLFELNKTAKKDVINAYNAGDKIACINIDGIFCIMELTKNNPSIDNLSEAITGNSYLPLDSHLISAKWFKIN
jgi:hypothetical protein